MNDAIIANGQFYVRYKVVEWLRARFTAGSKPEASENWRLRFDVTDRPHLCILTVTDGVCVARVYLRSELGFFDEELADLCLIYGHADTPEIVSSGRIGGDEMGLAMGYLECGFALHEILRQAENVDSEADGVLVKLMGDVLQFEGVSGRKRPDLMCRSLFGGEQMMRPYPDESFAFGMEGADLFALTEEAEEGDEEAMERLAFAHHKGDMLLGIEQDLALAAYWYRKLAERGSASACFELAMLTLQGYVADNGAAQALYWMERARDGGSEDAFVYVDTCRTLVELHGRVDDGDLHSAVALAEMYMDLGSGVEDGDGFFARCVDMARRAADADVPEAMWVLAVAYENGCGVEEDGEQALHYYRRGSELGHAGCTHTLGCFYLSGDYLISDVDKGFAMCMQAAEQGYGPAMQTIGRCYQFGDGVPSSMKTALEWYEKYLETNDDPEFAQSVAYFKSIPGLAEDFGMELGPDVYTEYEREEFIPMPDPEGFSIGMFAVTIAFGDAEEYERELAAQGLLPDAPMPVPEEELTVEAFPRVLMKANEGDRRAVEILELIERVNGTSMF